MNWVKDLFDYLFKTFQWWITVLPWEQGIRVRLGKKKTLMKAGVYLRLPIIHEVFVQSTRKRFIQIPTQTLTTRDGVTITIQGAIGYSIKNIEKLYETIYHPESTLTAIAARSIASFVSTNNDSDVTPVKMSENAKSLVLVEDYGLGEIEISVTSFAKVKTFRLIQDSSWMSSDRYDEKYK